MNQLVVLIFLTNPDLAATSPKVEVDKTADVKRDVGGFPLARLGCPACRDPQDIADLMIGYLDGSQPFLGG